MLWEGDWYNHAESCVTLGGNSFRLKPTGYIAVTPGQICSFGVPIILHVNRLIKCQYTRMNIIYVDNLYCMSCIHLAIFPNNALLEEPTNKFLWITVSANIQPTAQISTGVEYWAEQSKTSGALWYKFPTWIILSAISIWEINLRSKGRKNYEKGRARGVLNIQSVCLWKWIKPCI